MRYRMALLLLTSLILNGCSPHGAMEYFDKNSDFERAMTTLRTGTLVEALKTKVLVNVIYLNRVDPDTYKEGEHFFVSAYREEDDSQGIFGEAFTLTLNGEKPAFFEELDKEHPIVVRMPLTVKWSRYYHVRFSQIESNDMILSLRHNSLGTISVKYAKDELEK